MCINKLRNNSIKRTGENIIYYSNLQNKNKTSQNYWKIIQRSCTRLEV